MVGKSQIRINAQGIFLTTAGVIEIKNAQNKVQTGSKVNVNVPVLPNIKNAKNFLELNYHYPDLTPVGNATYKVIFADGSVREGLLNAKGYARLEGVPLGKSQVYYGEDPNPFVADEPEDLNAEIAWDANAQEDDLWHLLDDETAENLAQMLQDNATNQEDHK